MTDLVSKGISMRPDQVRDLDDRRDERDAQELERVTRSDVARNWLDWGRAVDQVAGDVSEFRRLPVRDQQGFVRQAIIDKLERDFE